MSTPPEDRAPTPPASGSPAEPAAALGEEIELDIERIVTGGDGLGFVDGVATFVPGSAAGERVKARILKRRSDFQRAELIQIIRASAARREPPCPVARECGGCTLQHLEYPSQLLAKRDILIENLRRLGGLDLPPTPELVGSDDEWGYRLRADLKVDWPEGRPRLGYCAQRSHDVVAIPGCPILGEGFARAFSPLVKLLNQRAFLFRGLTGVSYLEGDDGTLIALKYNREPGRRGQLFEALRWLAMEAQLAGAVVLGPRSRPILNWGRQRLSLKLGPEEDSPVYRMEPETFVQTHRVLASKLWQRTAQLAEEQRPALAWDLYGGAGFFALALAAHCARVLSVEGNKKAARLARRNIEANGMKNVSAVNETSARFLERATSASTPELVLVDPPRQGLEAQVRRGLVRLKPARLVYISCESATLARDARELTAGGYALETLEVYDFFPHTSHFETLARFRATS